MADADSAVPERKRVRGRKAAAKSGEDHPETPDPVDIAMKAVASGAVPRNVAQVVLEKHACLIDVQCRREREELGNVRVQRITRWLVLAAVAALLLGLAAMLISASGSRALVIEPFDVPPALQQRGITGKVVSARLLDRLSDLQRQTESTRAESSYANNWEDQIQVAVPDTGISLGEAWRTLRRWLGEETRIGGEVVQTATGLAITTRAGSLTGGTVEGPESELNRLLDEAAQSIYRATQPYRYAISLPPARDSDREQVLLSLVDHPEEQERKWAYSGLSVTYRNRGDLARAIVMAQEALALDPRMITAWENIGIARQFLGHDEAAIAAFERSGRVERAGLPSEFDPNMVAVNRSSSSAWVALRRADGQEAYRQAERSFRGSSRRFRLANLSFALGGLALLHDYRAIARLAARADFTPQEAIEYDWPSTRAAVVLTRAVDFHDPAMARQAIDHLLRAADRIVAANPTGTAFALAAENSRQRFYWPYLAHALARTGFADEAASLAARTPVDCYDCVHARAVAASAQRNRRDAERWFREAIRQAPSLPWANYDWGLMLLGLDDLSGAAAHFQRAHVIAPRWADPLKAVGDIRMRQGRWTEAEQSLREASERAPQWGALHLAWGRALWRIGRQEEAREKLRAAGRMILSPQDRSRLHNMMRRAGI